MNSVPDRSGDLRFLIAHFGDLSDAEIADAEYQLGNGDKRITVAKQIQDDRAHARFLTAPNPKKLLTEEAS
jgi:hypothetical protein